MVYSNNDILKTFSEAINDTAVFISKLAEHKRKFQYISEQTMDNADPECDASECLEKLGILLATLNIYKEEYTQDPIDETTGKLKRDTE